MQQGVELVAAQAAGVGEARREFVAPGLGQVERRRGLHERLEGRRGAAHVGRRAEDDGVGVVQPLPVLVYLFDRDQLAGAAKVPFHATGHGFGHDPGVPVATVIDHHHVAHWSVLCGSEPARESAASVTA
ncbi:hypothetical protein D9M72_558670 [compost metagenome]